MSLRWEDRAVDDLEAIAERAPRAAGHVYEAVTWHPCARAVDASLSKVVGLVAGAGLAVGTIRLVRTQPTARRLAFAAATLPIAAFVYPAARKRWALDSPTLREATGAVGYGLGAACAVRTRPRTAQRLLALGWASHALFDVFHHRGDGSRLPEWYSPLCAGYDLVIAADLVLWS